MILKSVVLAGVCLLGVSAAPPLRAQGGCASAPDAAVQCFVGNAVRTNLVTLQYGMTMTQFKAYGVSVSKIVQEQPTALAVVGLASAVADALPPTNANGSANPAAQTTAIDAIVDAGLADNILILPAETTAQDLKWFSLDLVNVMNTTSLSRHDAACDRFLRGDRERERASQLDSGERRHRHHDHQFRKRRAAEAANHDHHSTSHPIRGSPSANYLLVQGSHGPHDAVGSSRTR
jgi:hypothetical protein